VRNTIQRLIPSPVLRGLYRIIRGRKGKYQSLLFACQRHSVAPTHGRPAESEFFTGAFRPVPQARDFLLMTDLFSQVIDFENLYAAYHDACASKRYRSSILKFGYRLEENLITLQKDLANKKYRHGGYREFIINDSKKRLIKAAPFRDRVVHHAVCNVIEPIFERSFIYDSYACRNGKGTHAAILRLEYFIRSLESARAVERERERERVRRRLLKSIA